MSLLNKIAKSYTNLMGWHTSRKIVVIESDDWGSLRMPNKDTYRKLSQRNDKIRKDTYSRIDTIAGVNDLELLFETLIKFKDFKGNHPVITANTIVANPNFKKIRDSNYEEYHYEEFHETIKNLDNGEQILKLWQEGTTQKVFKPQLHGREHLHVPLWLEELKLGNKDLTAAFEEGCFSVPYTPILTNKRKNLMSALDFNGLTGEAEYQENYIREAAAIFTNYFGYVSKSFIAPAYIWHPQIENVMKSVGIDFLQGLPVQYIPIKNKNQFKKKLHYTGQKNSLEQYYLTRNVFFEPTSNPEKDWVNLALKRIESTFKRQQPVIIGAHRINFMGSLIQQNRDENLKLLNELLNKIVNNWPDVEFMTSDQLGSKINKSR